MWMDLFQVHWFHSRNFGFTIYLILHRNSFQFHYSVCQDMRKLLDRINILHILHTIRLNCGESLVKYSLCIVFRDACCTLRFNRSTYVYRELRIGQGVYNGYANITDAGSARVLGKFPSSPAHQAPPSICWYAVLLLHLRHSLLFEIQRIQGIDPWTWPIPKIYLILNNYRDRPIPLLKRYRTL